MGVRGVEGGSLLCERCVSCSSSLPESLSSSSSLPDEVSSDSSTASAGLAVVAGLARAGAGAATFAGGCSSSESESEPDEPDVSDLEFCGGCLRLAAGAALT